MKLKRTNSIMTAAALGAFLSFSSVGWSQTGAQDAAAAAANSERSAPGTTNSPGTINGDSTVTATGYCTGGSTANTAKTKIACESARGTWVDGQTGMTQPLDRNVPAQPAKPLNIDPNATDPVPGK